ncbi:MAG: hypothetical protein VXU42_01585, partial [Verrucomicrobiota bacterium]|nr:hypothetical protein [Verrucomicrobiota bacterium]
MPRTSNHFRSILSFRCISLGALILLASTLPSLVADIRYTDSGNDHLWSNTDNWQGSIAPNDSSTGAANWYDGTQLEIPSGTNAVCRGFMLGMYGSNNTAVIAGGTLACNWLDIGRSNHKGGNGTLTITSGSATVNGLLSIPNQDSSNTNPAN